MKHTFQKFVGNVYKNVITGNEWRIVKTKERNITLQDKWGNQFVTIPEGMGNYIYEGKEFRRRY